MIPNSALSLSSTSQSLLSHSHTRTIFDQRLHPGRPFREPLTPKRPAFPVALHIDRFDCPVPQPICHTYYPLALSPLNHILAGTHVYPPVALSHFHYTAAVQSQHIHNGRPFGTAAHVQMAPHPLHSKLARSSTRSSTLTLGSIQSIRTRSTKNTRACIF